MYSIGCFIIHLYACTFAFKPVSCDIFFTTANVPLIDDTPQACADHAVPSLPSLAPLDVGVADHLVPTFLCVCEFLHNFTTPLKLKKPMTSGEW